MDTTFIESMIAQHCADANTEPELHDLLAVVAEREGVQVQARDLEHGARFVCGYIEQVPYMMKVAWTAARNVGLEAEMLLKISDSVWPAVPPIVFTTLAQASSKICSLPSSTW